MLSHDEQRRFDAIERQLEAEDAHRAEWLCWQLPCPASRWRRLAALIAVLLGFLGTMSGMLFNNSDVVIWSLVLLFGGALWLSLR
ncbi:MAG TPA: DUF3040 domain-containing protein [Pseudonocardia sp.]